MEPARSILHQWAHTLPRTAALQIDQVGMYVIHDLEGLRVRDESVTAKLVMLDAVHE